MKKFAIDLLYFLAVAIFGGFVALRVLDKELQKAIAEDPDQTIKGMCEHIIYR